MFRQIVLASLLLLVISPTWVEIEGDAEKIPGWVFQYENDAAGVRVDGNKNRLINAVRSGADIKIAFLDIFVECTQTQLALVGTNEHVICYFGRNNMLSGSINPPVFRPTPERTFELVNSLGEYALLRVAFNGHTTNGQSTGTLGVRWYARVR